VAKLDDPDADVRRVTVEVLGRLGDKAAVPALLAKLDDPTLMSAGPQSECWGGWATKRLSRRCWVNWMTRRRCRRCRRRSAGVVGRQRGAGGRA